MWPGCSNIWAVVQGAKVAPAAVAVAVGLTLRYAAPIPEGLTDQVGPWHRGPNAVQGTARCFCFGLLVLQQAEVSVQPSQYCRRP